MPVCPVKCPWRDVGDGYQECKSCGAVLSKKDREESLDRQRQICEASREASSAYRSFKKKYT